MSSNNESESSLPAQKEPTIQSSPPLLTDEPSICEVENVSEYKGNPSATQHVDAPPPQRMRLSSNETERPQSAQQLRAGADEEIHSVSDAGEDESDPAERIIDFDWNDLHERYHEAINKCHDQETELMQEWESLMNYFHVWADAGHGHETGRTYSRLRTRMAYVQHSEDKLEKTRAHYINVVRAFESALNLLKASGFGS